MKTPPHAALEASLALVRDRPVGGNAHPSMLQTRTISASRLTKATAKELALEILRDDQSRDPESAHWGENGNALAAMNLANVQCQEPALRVPVPGTEWVITGHADGLAYFDEAGVPWPWPSASSADAGATWWGTVYENKAPMHDYDAASIELAYRQGLLYLAMSQAGPSVLGHAAWLPPGNPWVLPSLRRPGQVVVCLTPYDSPKREIAFPVDQNTCDKHLTRMIGKAAVIIAAVEADDAELAATWDDVKDRGLDEFNLRGSPPEITDGDLLAAIELERTCAEAKKAAEAAHDEAKATLERFLKSRGLEEAKAGPYRVALQRTKGGIRHFLVDDSVSLRVYGGKKKAEAVAADLLVTA